MTITLPTSRHGSDMTITTVHRDRPVQRTIHPARRVAGAALTALGATTAVIAVVTGTAVLLGGAGAVLVGFAVSHRWTRPARRTRLASAPERDASADYDRRHVA